MYFPYTPIKKNSIGSRVCQTFVIICRFFFKLEFPAEFLYNNPVIQSRGGCSVRARLLSFLLAVLCLLLPLLSLLFTGCERSATRYAEIQQYHAESLTLSAAPADSITRFSNKVSRFINRYPDATADPLYPAIIENINQAWLRISIELSDSSWLDPIILDFTFGENGGAQ